MPHSPLISKIRCHSPNKNKSRVCNRNHIIYIATREGVDLSNTALDQKISDSIAAMENLQDESISLEAANDLYIKYIAERPRSHGLFGSDNVDMTDIKALGNQLADLTASGVCIYRGIVSLSELDALELGYDKKENWEIFMRDTIPDIAKQFNIPIDKLAWTAAVHAEKTHPHTHFMFWRTDNAVRSPFIHISKQNKCREIFSAKMFEAERLIEVKNKTLARDNIIEFGKDFMTELKPEVRLPGHLKDETLATLADKVHSLISELPKKGRINYQLVPGDVKTKVDEITSILLSQNDIKNEYNKYIESVNAISKTYSASEKKSEYTQSNSEFDIKKRIGNIVLATAKELRKEFYEQELNELQKEQQLVSGCYKIFRSTFSSLLRENNLQQDTSEFRTNSKAALKDLARKKGKNLHKENSKEST